MQDVTFLPLYTTPGFFRLVCLSGYLHLLKSLLFLPNLSTLNTEYLLYL